MPGGESLTGALRSRPFTLPAKLHFFLAGHDGYPGRPARKKNVARVQTLQRSGAVSKEASLLRQVVSAHGYRVVLLDDEAETTLHYISNK